MCAALHPADAAAVVVRLEEQLSEELPQVDGLAGVDVQVSIQHVSKLRGALPEVCFRHGAQIYPADLLEHGADLRQPVQVLGPEEPLLNVHIAPVQRHFSHHHGLDLLQAALLHLTLHLRGGLLVGQAGLGRGGGGSERGSERGSESRGLRHPQHPGVLLHGQSVVAGEVDARPAELRQPQQAARRLDVVRLVRPGHPGVGEGLADVERRVYGAARVFAARTPHAHFPNVEASRQLCLGFLVFLFLTVSVEMWTRVKTGSLGPSR
ncbi:hypothetical protein EYF80_016257 [Liparis tanakae]|uniref:Uncharacterized protein n=1 Tax=Liparis tanakae TaxID=230148 RepID=A0A4Z2I608_9TELE|nr:hypothetical protein EYF80_016257 [Liparis tanakae]